ncbi:hypothetical protein DAEQUDRAFT_747522 [Daedalea quercina L-15889]|uniref:Sister chromatid cohesion protein n=1 Tax=Daedalea quercina L-15889 TaxID=1314783 RepID=A0A165LCJ4_9APHY|nr:hypothetical protein DAEQUDRAFT_747522 [Daedalea quercina L-15889]
MDGRDWYSHPTSYEQTPSSPFPRGNRITTSSVQGAHGLLAVYPVSSATPSLQGLHAQTGCNHRLYAHDFTVARHLSHLSLYSTPSSYVQPHTSRTPGSYSFPHFPSSSDYAYDLGCLDPATSSPHDRNHWENARNEAVRHLGEQELRNAYQVVPNPWPLPYQQISSYQTPAFAHSVIQHSLPSSAYPTPPPPGIRTSSSSLANALGPPAPRPPRLAFTPEDSAEFFNGFVAQSAVAVDLRPKLDDGVEKRSRQSAPDSSDPLTLGPYSQTPQKRKGIHNSGSPSLKRRQSRQRPQTPQQPSTRQPSESLSKTLGSPTARGSLQPYVDVPPLHSKLKLYPYVDIAVAPRNATTPTIGKRKRQVDDEDADLGGFGPVNEGSPVMHAYVRSGVRSSAKRATGERDGRAPIEKFVSLLEDVFEAEDALSPDADPKDLPEDIFSRYTTDCAHPLLHSKIMQRSMKYILKSSRPVGRPRPSGRDEGTGAKGRMADVEMATLARLLKILERSVRSGHDVDPFETTAGPAAYATHGGSRRQDVKDRSLHSDGAHSRSGTPRSSDDQARAVSDDASETVDVAGLERALDIARDSILAANCCISLLSSDRLPKQLYSEELISACFSAVKNQLEMIVYPFVESAGDSQSRLLQHAMHPSSRGSNCRRQLAELFQALEAVIPRINDLVNADRLAMSEGIIIQVVYIAIGPFFVVENCGEGEGKGKKESAVLNTLGNSAMRGLRLDALALIRSVFAKHEEQRSWIIEEILTSLIKLSDSKQKAGQFRLRDGQSIRTVSALLLQLIQTSAHDVRIDVQDMRRTREQEATAQRRGTSTQRMADTFLSAHESEELRLFVSGLDSATKAAKTIVLFLTQRSGKSKSTKNSNEAEYRVIFDNLISDLLCVLFWPEWPAASLLLSIICKYMVASLDDVKAASQADNQAMKTLALDHLGIIAARIRTTSSQMELRSGTTKKLRAIDEVRCDVNILSTYGIKRLRALISAHRDLASYLCSKSDEDQSYDSARDLTAVVWGQELATALQHCASVLVDECDMQVDRDAIAEFGSHLKDALQHVWENDAGDVFDVGGSQGESPRMHRLCEEIGTIQTFKNSFTPILNAVLKALDAPPVFMRTKALKALGQIVTSDPSILSFPNVRRAIESHLLDSSSAVRDAAVELIGKYMVESPEFAADYFQKITERIADTGLGVRKRVIRLLKSYYAVTTECSRRIEICVKIVLRMLDEDDTVKDLATKTIEELWFGSTPQRSKSNSIQAMDRADLQAKATIIMGVAGHFKDRQSPMEDMLHDIMNGKNSEDASLVTSRYAEICGVLIDGLVDASELPDFTVVNCVRTIHLFTSAYPAVLSGFNAATLLPYLKNATTPEEQVISDYLLRIFRVMIPYMPKTALKFGQELQLALQPMIIKPSSASGLSGLQETVACMCAIVEHITHDFDRLVALLRSCNARLQQALSKLSVRPITGPEQRALSILLFIVSLLCEHCSFDQLRVERETYSHIIIDIPNTVTKGPIIEHVYNSLLKLYHKHNDVGLRGRILQCLGFLFRAQPALMTAEPSAAVMDAIFSSPEEEGRARLLRILQDFLVSEAAKHAAKEKASSRSKPSTSTTVNMEELVGNTDGFAESGVSSAVVQRYLDPILLAALSPNPTIQLAAVDILSFTIKQGLAHPLQSFPVIVALETSPNASLSARASALHSILHGKHTSLLNSRFVVSARVSFDYQKKLDPGQVQGYRMTPNPTALLHRWYSLVREKRATRQDFLKSLVKVFDVEAAAKAMQDDIDFVRYMAENFAAFEYKTHEEVLTVLKYLTAVLSTAGMQLVEMLSPSHLLAQLHAPTPTETPSTVQSNDWISAAPSANLEETLPLMRRSVIVAMIMLLKAYLKGMYGISEEKCAKWVVGKKSAAGDKAATRRHERPLLWERLPFAVAPILTGVDVESQRTKFLEIWNEDGLTAEPEDDFM